MAELRPNIVVHGRNFVRHVGICNPICVKLLQVMSSVIPSNLKHKWRLYLKPFSWGPQTRHTHTQTDTRTHARTHHTHTPHTHTHTLLKGGSQEWQCVKSGKKYENISCFLDVNWRSWLNGQIFLFHLINFENSFAIPL